MTRTLAAIACAAFALAAGTTASADEAEPVWTAPFGEGSHFEGSWEAGAKIRFLGPGGQGITSEIAESRRPDVVSIRHLGMVKDGVEDFTSPEATAWAPSYETYTFAGADGGTEVTVALDVPPDFEEYMSTTWPKALARLKEICEAPAP